ncbi:MAG: single-stranded DNA-binding protein [Patescibacteria group bacterium]
MDLNRAQIIGNVTRDPESRTTPGGQTVCNFGVATNMQWTDQAGAKQNRAEFHNIVAWGKLAEICTQYLTKGRRVFLEGRLQTRDWEAQDGAKRRTTEIVAENMILLDRGTGQTGPGASAQAPSNEPTIVPTNGPVGALDKGMGHQEIRVEDIPF